MLHAAEALLLGDDHQSAVHHQARRGVAVISVHAENDHVSLILLALLFPTYIVEFLLTIVNDYGIF